MSNLDELKEIAGLDKESMLSLIESFPVQCRDARKIGLKFDLPEELKAEYENITFTGLGGSAIGADLVRSYVAGEARLPLFVNRNYTLPHFVGNKSLVVAASYSGNTEETLSAYRDARAKKARIIAVTSGGELAKQAKADGAGLITIPQGFPPRCALGYSFFPLLVLLSRIGVISDKSGEIDEAIDLMEKMRIVALGHEIPERRNKAKKIARFLRGKYPIIYGGQDHIDSVVTRWRGQIAENSKALASSHVFPEMNHNEIVGWENPKALLKYFVILMLRDKGDHPRIAKRMDITRDIIMRQGVKVLEVNSEGKGLLARIFSLIYIGDFASFYLAILNKVDPTPVERVTFLKKELANI